LKNLNPIWNVRDIIELASTMMPISKQDGVMNKMQHVSKLIFSGKEDAMWMSLDEHKQHQTEVNRRYNNKMS
jgi:gamma-glutamyl:cysteine ligase YbdK (ATP-grasp superfamily)